MKQVQLISIFLLAIACDSGKHDSDQRADVSDERTESQVKVDESEVSRDTLLHQVTAGIYTLDDVQGVWGESAEENAYFFIKNDSAVYIDGDVVAVGVSHDSLVFYYPGYPMSCKINWIRGDTMSLMIYEEPQRLIRVSN